MRVGLVLGKFAPLHRGHQLLIEEALRQVERLYILVYESPEIPEVPGLSVRAQWIRALYPKARVLEGWGAPADAGRSVKIQRLQERYIASMLPEKVTHLFSSEWYGAHVSLALGADDVRVDQSRSRVPVSATLIRSDPYAHRNYLHPKVYADLIQRIVFLGAESTGKSTLAEACALSLTTEWTQEYGREYWEAHHDKEGQLSAAQLVELAQRHLLSEAKQVVNARRFLFVDTNAITTELFCRAYHGSCPSELLDLSLQCGARYARTFVCDDDIPYVEDGTRSGEAERQRRQKAHLRLLEERNIPFILLKGSIEERIKQVRTALLGGP